MTKFQGGTPGIGLWAFNATVENELLLTAQMPHNWRKGTNVIPHVHWTTNEDTSGDNGETVIWGIEHVIGEVGGSFTSPATVEATHTLDAVDKNNKSIVTGLAEIDMSAFTLSTILAMRLYRKALTDTWDKQAYLLEFDLHYQIDGLGSDEAFAKGF